MTVREIFSKHDLNTIKEAIMNAELDTSGEIRVHLENSCQGESMDRALFWFKKLHMEKTEQRNALLFYFAVKSRKFAIIGDQGIHEAVHQDFWDLLRNEMLERFHENDFVGGLVQAINRAGEELRTYFPFHRDDVNELSDDISIEDN